MQNIRHIHQISPRHPTDTAFTTIASAKVWARQQFGEISNYFTDESGFIALTNTSAHVFWLDDQQNIVRYLTLNFVNA